MAVSRHKSGEDRALPPAAAAREPAGLRPGGFRMFLKTLSDLFWPPVCAVCSRLLPLTDESRGAAGHFCPQCFQAVEFHPDSLCPVCGRPFYHAASHLCGDCLASPPPYRQARSALVYQGPVGRSISRLKYYGDLTQVKVLADLARPAANALMAENQYQAVIPLPISSARLKERGFNQTEVLAADLFAPWRGRIDSRLLARPGNEKVHQARLSAVARRKAIKGSFALESGRGVEGAVFLIFDDVFTTGATASEAAESLMKAGAAAVDVFTLARTVLAEWR